MQVFRIEKKAYVETFPPRGSLFAEGRWNKRGMWVIYTSETIALAKLETLANTGSTVPGNRVLRSIEIKDHAPVIEITPEDLPADWYQVPYPGELATIIKRIIDSKRYAAAIVPSAQSRREHNVLLFPDFPEFDRYVKQVSCEPEGFDARLKK